MPTDTSEKGFETRIFNLLLESGWLPGYNNEFLPASCVDLAHLAVFLQGHTARRPPSPSTWTLTLTPANGS